MNKEYIEDISYGVISYYTVIPHLKKTRPYYNDYINSIVYYLDLWYTGLILNIWLILIIEFIAYNAYNQLVLILDTSTS